MFKYLTTLLVITGLAGCSVAPTSTVEPPPRTGSQGGYEQPRSGNIYGPRDSGGYGSTSPDSRENTGYTPPTPAPSSTRRTPTVASYSSDSTGVSAADSLLREGKTYHQRGQYANAANNFERAIRMAPRSPALYLALAKTRFALNDYNNAVQMANRALSLLPSEGWGVSDARADAWTIIADSRAASGDNKGASAARAKAREYW